jgi:hypothetical protein
LALDVHELVHAYVEPIAVPPPWLVEGLAAAISCDPEVAHTFDEYDSYVEIDGTNWEISLLASRSARAESNRTSVLGGMLTAWLVDEHGGMSPVMRLYRSLRAEADASETNAMFQEVYGRTLDQLWFEFSEAATRRGCLSVSSCAALAGELPLDAVGHTAQLVPSSGLRVEADS